MNSRARHFFLLLAAVGSSAAWAQSTVVRPQSTATTVQPAGSTQTVVTTPPPTVDRGTGTSDTASQDPFPQVTPTHDHIKPDGRGEWHLEQPPSIAAVWQPLNEQTEVFAIDGQGVLKDVWMDHDGWLQPAFSLSGPSLAPAGAPLAAVWYPFNEQLGVYTIGTNGALTLTLKEHNGGWSAPAEITPGGFAPPGAHVTAVYQPLNNEIDVFTIDSTGAVRLAWKAPGRNWTRATLAPPGSAPPGAPISAVVQPLNQQMEVFWVDTTGAVRDVWKQHNIKWEAPFSLTGPGFANPRASIAAVWHPFNERLEVFTVDGEGAIKGYYKEHNHWVGAETVDGPDVAIPGATIAAMSDEAEERLTVVTVNTAGQLIRAYKTYNNNWFPGAGAFSQSLAPAGIAGTRPNGAAIAAILEPRSPMGSIKKRRRSVFTIDDNQAVRQVIDGYSDATAPPITRASFGPIYGAHAAACSAVFRSWSGGNALIEDQRLQDCLDFMGLTAYCDARDAGVTIGYSDSGRFFRCSSRAGSNDVVDQFIHIWTGIGQGLGEAAVATIVYSPEIIQGYACLDGVAFACASLAVDLAVRADAIPPEVQDAADLVNQASSCVDGDVISCAKLGAAGARAAGVEIPGEEARDIAQMAQRCLNEDDYGACVRLGEKAADAAGVPVDQINEVAKNLQDCYASDVDACIALGKQAAAAGIPVGGIADGAGMLERCYAKSINDCQDLGRMIASTPR